MRYSLYCQALQPEELFDLPGNDVHKFCSGFNACPCDVRFVSYTHLDVYKRQDKLYHSHMVFGNEQRIGALVKGKEYYVRVDAFNENGITEGKSVKILRG